MLRALVYTLWGLVTNIFVALTIIVGLIFVYPGFYMTIWSSIIDHTPAALGALASALLIALIMDKQNTGPRTILLLIVWVISVHVCFQWWATDTALKQIVARLISTEGLPKCVEKLKRQGGNIETEKWLKEPKRFSIRLGGGYASVWDFSSPLWRKARTNVTVYINPRLDQLGEGTLMVGSDCVYRANVGTVDSN